MADTTVPDWDAFPCLDGIITKADIETKGQGNFKADYVPWMKIMALLAQHAPGWHFALREDCHPETGVPTPLYRSGDGTAYIKGYFRAPQGSNYPDTPELVFPVMNHKNNAIEYDSVSARDLSDADRRCRCAAAAVFFRLGWQLWTKDPIENPYREVEEKSAETSTKRASTKPKVNQPPQAEPMANQGEPSIQQKVSQVLRPLFGQAGNDALTQWRTAYKLRFNGAVTVDEDKLTGAHIQTEEQFQWTEAYLNDLITAKAS